MKKFIFVIFLLVVAWFATAYPSEKVLNIATVDFPPYEYKTGHTIDGISVRVVKETFKRMNQPISIKLLPWSRALVYLETGKIDGLFDVLQKPERKKYADFCSEVLISETISLFVLADSNIVFDGNFSKLKTYTFGVRQDFSYGPKFDQALSNNVISKIIKQVDIQSLLILLRSKNIHILIGDKFEIPHACKTLDELKSDKFHMKRTKIKRLSPDVQSTPSYMAFSKKQHLVGVRDRFDRVLSEMKKEGTYSRLIDTWVGPVNEGKK